MSSSLAPVDLTERISVSYGLQGDPSLVTYVAVYPSATILPTKERIIERASVLVEEFPLLKARIVDAKTTSPKWSLLPDSEVDVGLKSLVRDVSVDEVRVCGTGSTEGSSGDISRTLEKIFERELNDIQSVGISSNGFLWRVVGYHHGTNRDSDLPAYIAMTCHHVISDGRSGQALLEALLSDTALDTSGTGQPTIAPAMQATINCRPSLPFMLEQVWYEVIVPKLPRFLGDKLKKTPCWPFAPPFSPQSEQLEAICRNGYSHTQLSADELKHLKDVGKSNDVSTLQPTLQMAAVVALWISVRSNPSQRDASANNIEGLRIGHRCVASYRQPTLGHRAITGNYVGGLESGTTCPDDGDIDFWQAVREYAIWLHSSTTRRRGCQIMGALRFIPDGDNTSAGDSSRPTGWEIFFLDRAKRQPTISFNVSNLGFHKRPPGSIGMAWSQTPIVTAPLHISIIGHDGGLDINVARVVGAWIDEAGYEPLARFTATYEKVLKVLADPCERDHGKESVSNLTFGDIQSMVGGE
jgi:hypothetical protein